MVFACCSIRRFIISHHYHSKFNLLLNNHHAKKIHRTQFYYRYIFFNCITHIIDRLFYEQFITCRYKHVCRYCVFNFWINDDVNDSKKINSRLLCLLNIESGLFFFIQNTYFNYIGVLHNQFLSQIYYLHSYKIYS